jgi:neprilysin
LLTWLNFFSPSILLNSSQVVDDEELRNYNLKFLKFWDKTSTKRTRANFVGWRTVQASLFYSPDVINRIFLNFETKLYGKQDLEQRYQRCLKLVVNKVAVGVGALYISRYFKEEDKKVADEIFNFILNEYKNTLNNSLWMDYVTKTAALEKVSNVKKYIGYHEKLLTDSNGFYDNLYVNGKTANESHFLELGFAYEIFNTDREYNQLRMKNPPPDWTKYSRPATINAFYNSRDNSIRKLMCYIMNPSFVI